MIKTERPQSPITAKDLAALVNLAGRKPSRETLALSFVLVLLMLTAVFFIKHRNDTAAYVNGERLMVFQINKRIENIKAADPYRFSGPEGEAEERKVRKMVLDEFIVSKLIQQNAFKSEVTVSAEEIDLKIKQRESLFGGPAPFTKQLEKEGYNYSSFRDVISQELAGLKIRIKLAQSVTVADSEVRDYILYNKEPLKSPVSQVKLSQIVLGNDKQAQEVLKQLAKGGGETVNLGWIPMSFLDEAARSALAGLEIGGHTSPIPNPDNTLSIYKLNDRRERMSTETEYPSQVRLKLLIDKRKRSFDQWFRVIQQQAVIQSYL